MMNNSKAEFHDMFQKTYGKIYLQNSDVFSDFFKELELYYKKGSTRLSDTLEAFFVVLYQRMFTVLNSQYSFDEKYLECVSDHMKDVRPFDDVPHKFTLQLKRSFVATRTYYKALSTAAEAARRLMNVRIDKECETELVNMRYCGSCSGLRGMGTCSTYCTAVLQACLRHHTAFSSEWDHFIGESAKKTGAPVRGSCRSDVRKHSRSSPNLRFDAESRRVRLIVPRCFRTRRQFYQRFALSTVHCLVS
jgi:glypican 4 (K-glypican)